MEPRFPGKLIQLGGVGYVVPAIGLRKVRELLPRLQKLTPGRATTEDIDTIVDMVFAALSRNYPDMKKEDLEDLLDLKNCQEVVRVVAEESGMIAEGKPELEGTPSP
jgi:hypothetical protein